MALRLWPFGATTVVPPESCPHRRKRTQWTDRFDGRSGFNIELSARWGRDGRAHARPRLGKHSARTSSRLATEPEDDRQAPAHHPAPHVHLVWARPDPVLQ